MRAQEKNISGFSLFELLVVIVIVSIISAAAYPNFSSWKKEREVRGAALKIKNLITSINSQAQRGLYGFVQVLIEEDKGKVLVTSKGMKMDNLTTRINDGANIWNSDVGSRCNMDDADYWDDDGATSNKLEVAHLTFDHIAINFESNVGAVCFSKDGTWYSGSGTLLSEAGRDTAVDSVFFICNRTSSIARCNVAETNGEPNIDHDNLFAITWTRFGNVTLEKWSKSQEDWFLQ